VIAIIYHTDISIAEIDDYTKRATVDGSRTLPVYANTIGSSIPTSMGLK
jgi:hypothetical protein